MKHRKALAITMGLLGITTLAGLATYAVADQQNKPDRMAHNSSQHHQNMGGHRFHGGKRRGNRNMAYLMERFDVNKDRKLTQEELDQARITLLSRHDKNGDGQLTLSEFETLWLEFMRQRMVRSFQRIDRDGDAVLTQEEFLEPYSRIVERLDRNDDGVLDENDRRRRFRKHQQQENHENNPAPQDGAN